MTTVVNDTVIDATAVCGLLRKLAARYAGLPVTLVLDNARYQKCEVVRLLAAELKIELLYLPAYSPNLNLIERLWKLLRQEAFCRSYDSFEDMQRGVSAVLDHLEKYHPQLDTLMTEDFHVFHPQDYPECCAASPI